MTIFYIGQSQLFAIHNDWAKCKSRCWNKITNKHWINKMIDEKLLYMCITLWVRFGELLCNSNLLLATPIALCTYDQRQIVMVHTFWCQSSSWCGSLIQNNDTYMLRMLHLHSRRVWMSMPLWKPWKSMIVHAIVSWKIFSYFSMLYKQNFLRESWM
jgi:hypothetical protein